MKGFSYKILKCKQYLYVFIIEIGHYWKLNLWIFNKMTAKVILDYNSERNV